MLVAQWLAVLATAVAAQSSSEPTTTSVTPSSTSNSPVPTANADLEVIAQRRRADLATFATPARVELLPTWLAAQGEDGRWSDVDYRMGCEAQRANWPIQEHWIRVITMASAWSGLNPWSSDYTDNLEVLAAALKGMDWWFANDYTNPACIGGTPNDQCPCGTPGLWNTNWFGQVILMPQLVSTACVLVQPANLTQTQYDGCVRIPKRAYDVRDGTTPGVGRLTGANTVSVMQNSVSLAVFMRDATILKDALDRAMRECVFVDTATADGIHRDGSFLQHVGILYNGNYGKDLMNAFIQLESEATGTAFAAGDDTREAIAAQVRGNEWMTFRDKEDGRLKWDYNVIGRFIAFPTPDLQASADININNTLLERAVSAFSGTADLSDVIERLTSNLTSPLEGNKGFWASDYMVHRGQEFTLANKMISKRSTNNEYTNSANPWGYFTGQGTLFNYVTGTEYKDIQAQWDWHLIPGVTTLLHVPQLNSSWVTVTGLKDFVGVVSNGKIGLSAMSYTAPHDKSISFNRAWFYLGDSVLVTTANVTVDRSVPGIGDAPVVTVLDNRAAVDGGIEVDGKKQPSGNTTISGRTLLYGGNGYLSHEKPFSLTLSEEVRSGNWSSISTSKAGVQSAKIFSAYTAVPDGVYSYQIFPATDAKKLAKEAKRPTVTPLSSGSSFGAVSDQAVALAFFESGTLQIRRGSWDLTISSSQPALVLVTPSKSAHGKRGNVNGRGKDQGTEHGNSGHGNGDGHGDGNGNGNNNKGYEVTVSDPTQQLASVQVSIAGKGVQCPANPESTFTCSSSQQGVTLDVQLPTGGFAGSSVRVALDAGRGH